MDSSPESSTPKQSKLNLEPEYAEADGIKFEFSGTLLVPTPEETKRLDREREFKERLVVAEETHSVIASPQSHYYGFRNTTKPTNVKMSALQMHKLRTKGA